jgi:hypothetical protein
MEFQHQFPRVLPVIMLACSLLPAMAQAQFSQQAKLVGTDAVGEGASQGTSVSLSADGNTAIVGGFFDSDGVGAAWVYTRSGRMWNQQAKLVGTGVLGGCCAYQGVSVSLSADGNTAVIGGPEDNFGIGAAWVYTRTGSVWRQQTKLIAPDVIGEAGQGTSIALSSDGNTVIIGGPGDNNSLGAAWAFTRSGGIWSQQAKLVGTLAVGAGSVLGLYTFQGSSVSVSGDGNTAIVGGSGDNNYAGAAWVFTRSGTVWNQQGPKLVGTGATSSFGWSVSLSSSGDTAIIGAPAVDKSGDNGGVVFTRSAGVWTQQATVVGTGVLGPFPANQGYSVSISYNGNIAIVGGRGDNSYAGAAWVFTRLGATWNQASKMVGTGGIGFAQQGSSVSLSGDGSTAIVGGPLDNNEVGAAWVFTQPLFAGTPGIANCQGQSVSALAKEYGGLNNAAAILGYSSVSALQDAIMAFCEA